MPVDVWVDAQHHIVQEKVSLTVSAKPSSTAAAQQVTTDTTIRLSGFGTPVQVTAPPASQTTDLTKTVGSGSGS